MPVTQMLKKLLRICAVSRAKRKRTPIGNGARKGPADSWTRVV
jgi:hypothetical protein